MGLKLYKKWFKYLGSAFILGFQSSGMMTQPCFPLGVAITKYVYLLSVGQ